MTTKTGRIVRSKLGADGRLHRITASGKFGAVIRGRVDPKRINSPAAFAPDADTPVLTRRELRELRPVQLDEAPDVAALRRRLRLSQGAFATLFGIPLATVKDWEQGRRTPDAPARAYLRVIARNPKAVRSALKTAAE
jgi:putative transcriptional regulator